MKWLRRLFRRLEEGSCEPCSARVGYWMPSHEMPQPHPENVGVGSVECRCGGLRFRLSGVGPTSAAMQCPTCGEWSEVLVTKGDR